MSNSTQILKRFSMYTLLQDRQYGNRVMFVHKHDQTLESLMEYLVESVPNADEEYWARYFLRVMIEAPKIYSILISAKVTVSTFCLYTIYLKFSYNFLFSYLQLVCLSSAQQVSKQLRQSSNMHLHYPVEECFLIASEVSLKPASILSNFQFNSTFSLQAYATKALIRIIKNRIVSNLKSQALKFSDRGLLRNISKNQLERALREYGFSTPKIEIHCLVWQTFKEVLAELNPPNQSGGTQNSSSNKFLSDRQLSELVKRYKQQLQRLNISSEQIREQELEKMLTTCTQAVRISQNKKLVSLEEYGNVSDIPSNSLEILIEAEKQEEVTQMKQIILDKFAKLKDSEKKCLLLWLGLNIKQSDFVSILNLTKQFQVSREFKRSLEEIMKNLPQIYLQECLGRQPTELEINKLCEATFEEIKEYLSFYSKTLFNGLLKNIIIQQTSLSEKNILTQYIKNLHSQKKGKITSKKMEKKDDIDRVIFGVQKMFEETIEEQIQIKLNQLSSADNRVKSFIKQWLEDNQAILLSTGVNI